MKFLKMSFEFNSLFKSLDKNDLHSFYRKLEKYKLNRHWNVYYPSIFKQMIIKNNIDIDETLNKQIKLYKFAEYISLYNVFNSNICGFFPHTINKYFLHKNYFYHFDINKYHEFVELLLLDLKVIDINLYYKALVVLHNDFKEFVEHKPMKKAINHALFNETSKDWIKQYENDFKYVIENIYLNEKNSIIFNETYSTKYLLCKLLYVNHSSILYVQELFNFWYK